MASVSAISYDDVEMDTVGIAMALVGLDGAIERHTRDRRDDCSASRAKASASFAECAMWVSAIDQHLVESDSDYKARRDADADGQYVVALCFLRDRVVHQLVAPNELDDTPFLSRPDDNYLFYISPGLVCVPLDRIREPADGRENTPRYQRSRGAYQELLQDKNSLLGPTRARAFLDRELHRELGA